MALAPGQGLDAVTRALDGRCAGPGGISPVVPGVAELGRARRLAELALRTCPPDATRVVRLDQRMPTALVVSQPELADRLVSDVFGALLELEPGDRAVLLETLVVWLVCEGSAGRAAGRPYCHRNTVFNRLRRLEQLTSCSPHPAPGPDRDDVGTGRVPVVGATPVTCGVAAETVARPPRTRGEADAGRSADMSLAPGGRRPGRSTRSAHTAARLRKPLRPGSRGRSAPPRPPGSGLLLRCTAGRRARRR